MKHLRVFRKIEYIYATNSDRESDKKITEK